MAGALTAASLIPVGPRAASLLQTGAGTLATTLWLWTVAVFGNDPIPLFTGASVASAAAWSISEALVARRRTPDPDPLRRGIAALLGILALHGLLMPAYVALFERALWRAYLEVLATGTGRAAACGVLIWAIWTRQRWAAPIGLLLMGGFFAVDAWSLTRTVLAQFSAPTGTTYHVSQTIFARLPVTATEISAGVALALRWRRYGAAGSQPLPSAL